MNLIPRNFPNFNNLQYSLVEKMGWGGVGTATRYLGPPIIIIGVTDLIKDTKITEFCRKNEAHS